MRLSCKTRHGRVDLTIHNALLVPDFTVTLISVHQLASKKLSSHFVGDCCTVRDERTQTIALEASHEHGLYQVSCKPLGTDEEAHFAMDINDAHRKLGHTNFQSIQDMVRHGRLAGVTSLTGIPDFCEPCVLGKMKKQPFHRSQTVARGPLDIISSDVGGPVNPISQGGYRYWIVLVDHYSSNPWVLFARNKSSVYRKLKQWRKFIEAHFRAHIANWEFGPGWTRFFRTDGGGEYTSKQMEDEFRRNGIIHETTAPYTPEQTGIAERMNETLTTRATTNLAASYLPRKYWDRAMEHAAYTIARSPATAQKGSTPHERLFDRPVDVKHMHPFGCPAYPLIPKGKRKGKFADKAQQTVFIGYHEGSKAYDLLDITTGKITTAVHVKFNDQSPAPSRVQDLSEPKFTSTANFETFAQILRKRDLPYYDEDSEDIPSTTQSSISDAPTSSSVGDNLDSSVSVGEPISVPSIKTEPITVIVPPISPPLRQVAGMRLPPPRSEWRANIRSRSPSPPGPAPALRRSQRPPKPALHPNAVYEQAAAKPQHATTQHEELNTKEHPDPTQSPHHLEFVDEEDGTYAVIDDADLEFFAGLSSTHADPTWNEAMQGPDSDKWLAGLHEELSSLTANDVYEVVPIPEGVKPITSKPVLRVKFNAAGEIERYKVRIVARGFTQREGVDYNEVFAPVANLESIRIICALAAKYDLELDQLDVSTAYLNGELEEELYMMPPDCVQIAPGYCWRLKRSLYGLKQAGRTWNRTLDKKLRELQFTWLSSETCLYVYKEGKNLCFLVVYVDDLLLAGSSRQFMDQIKNKRRNTYKMRDLGSASLVLGLNIKRDRKHRTITLSQRKYIDSVLERCGMAECNPVFTPMATNAKMTVDDPVDNTTVTHMALRANGPVISYQSAVGMLMWAMLGTRPDLAYVTGIVGRYSANPKRCHWELLKRVFRYLKGTRDWGITYNGSGIGMDMNFLGYTDADWNGDNDTSRSTSGYVFISNDGAISWSSRRQSMVALSSTESEYIGLSNAGQHLAWLRSFFEEIGHPQESPTELRCDNRAAIILTKDPQFRARTKHIQRKYHYVRDGLVATGEAIILWYPTDEMVADIFTKPLPHDKHHKFCHAMGLPPGRVGVSKTDIHQAPAHRPSSRTVIVST